MKLCKQLFILALLSLLSFSAMAQQATVSGIVTDAVTGETIPGVNVRVKGSTGYGTSTGLNGDYTITVNNPENDILVFTYVGYNELELAVNNRTELNVQLQSSTESLEEVVVVGYGTQKKVNLTGAVSTISSTKLENRAAPNLSTTLSGLASGVTVSQSSGNPGSDGATIRIRGVGSFASNNRSPMIIVDGAQGDMNSVNPNDVESISVLKDAASAAIYGSRAANGVILITTKKGKLGAPPRITYSTILSSTKPSASFDLLSDYADYMELFKLAQQNVGDAAKYSQTEIDAWRAAKSNPKSTDNEWGIPNSLAYPNTSWTDILFKANFSQKHDLSVSGGSDNSSYLLSLGFMDNPGTLKNTALQRFQIRANVETKIGKYITFGTQTFAIKDRKEPGSTSFTYMFQNIPGQTPYYDGRFGAAESLNESAQANNLLAQVEGSGGLNTTTRINTTWYAKIKILDGLTGEARFNYQDYFYNSDTWTKSIPLWSFRTNTIRLAGTSLESATVRHQNTRRYQYTATAFLQYQKTFNKNHDINLMAGYEQFYYNTNATYASKMGMMDFSITDLESASEMYQINPYDSNDPDKWAERDYAMLSYFGRANYGYKNKYLFEFSFRYDASSRFGADTRWGFFPSLSGGWVISEENFMQNAKNIIQRLKLRGSWGKLGTIPDGYYAWQANYTQTGAYYSFGNKVYNGLMTDRLGNFGLKWENSNTWDIGLEAMFLNRRLSAEIGYYNRLTEGIITNPSIYNTMGTVKAPYRNTSDMRNQGIELTLGWRDNIGDFSYSVNVNASYNHNKVVKYKGKLIENWVDDNGTKKYSSNIGQVADFNGNGIRVEGSAFDEYFLRQLYKGSGKYYDTNGAVDPNGGPKDGMIRTPEDLQWFRDMRTAGYSFNGVADNKQSGYWYGEYIMADVNGDGNYGNSYDRVMTKKSSTPKYTYGINLSAAWKGIDFNMTWSGAAGMHYYVYSRGLNTSVLSSNEVLPADARKLFYFYNEADPTDARNNINAAYPRLKAKNSSVYIANDRYLYNASYIKLKNVQIGYTLPKKWMDKVFINSLRVFVSGENLWTITDYPGVDPEIGSSLNVYPISRIFSAGVNISF